MYNFASDYLEGCAPEILEALIKSNSVQSPGYGEDIYSLQAIELIKKAIKHDDVDIHFVPGGTGCNMLIMSAGLRPHEAVICADNGHINVHEAGSIEGTGHKIITTNGKDGKILPSEIDRVCKAHSDEHMVKPKMVFISNPTEFGSVYSKSELVAIKEVCVKNDLYLYMDGARLSCALALPNYDLSLKDITDLCDAYYIGGTKNGALLGEAMIIVNNVLKKDFRYILKQKGQMLAKNRVIGVSFKALFTNDLYLKLARHANKTAAALHYTFEALKIKSFVDSPTNQLFVILKNETVEKLQKKYTATIWGDYDENNKVVRFVTSWATKEEVIIEFASDLKKML